MHSDHAGMPVWGVGEAYLGVAHSATLHWHTTSELSYCFRIPVQVSKEDEGCQRLEDLNSI